MPNECKRHEQNTKKRNQNTEARLILQARFGIIKRRFETTTEQKKEQSDYEEDLSAADLCFRHAAGRFRAGGHGCEGADRSVRADQHRNRRRDDRGVFRVHDRADGHSGEDDRRDQLQRHRRGHGVRHGGRGHHAAGDLCAGARDGRGEGHPFHDAQRLRRERAADAGRAGWQLQG